MLRVYSAIWRRYYLFAADAAAAVLRHYADARRRYY